MASLIASVYSDGTLDQEKRERVLSNLVKQNSQLADLEVYFNLSGDRLPEVTDYVRLLKEAQNMIRTAEEPSDLMETRNVVGQFLESRKRLISSLRERIGLTRYNSA